MVTTATLRPRDKDLFCPLDGDVTRWWRAGTSGTNTMADEALAEASVAECISRRSRGTLIKLRQSDGVPQLSSTT
eukprot:2000240-Prymnesium_polylepis.1